MEKAVRNVVLALLGLAMALPSGCSGSAANGDSAELAAPPQAAQLAAKAKQKQQALDHPTPVPTRTPAPLSLAAMSGTTDAPDLAPYQRIEKMLGAGLGDGVPQITAEQTKLLGAAQDEARRWGASILAPHHFPLASGNGLVVAPPAGTDWKKPPYFFANGCTRWLQLTVGGQGDLGRTPTWGLVSQAASSLKLSAPQMTPPTVQKLARLCGATHYVTSQFSGGETNARLTLQLWKVPQQSVGAPLVLRGTQAQILAALPNAARVLATRLGAAKPDVPASVGVSPAEMATLGSVPWKGKDLGEGDAPPALQKIAALSAKTPLAGVLWMYSGLNADLSPQWHRVVANTMRLAPRNALVVAALQMTAYGYSSSYSKLYDASNKSLVQRYPRNFALAFGEVARRRGDDDYRGAVTADLKLIALNPDNFLAWDDLAESFSEQAEALRQSRTVGAMTPAEQKRVFQLYPFQLKATLRTVQLNPAWGEGWSDVSGAAAFAGEAEICDLAFWKALRLSPNTTEVLKWGLEIYQPKWFGDAARLRKVGQFIAQKPGRFLVSAGDLQSALHESGMSQEAAAVQEAFLQQCEAMKKAQPKSAVPYRVLKDYYENREDYPRTAEAYEGWLQREPDNVIAMTNYANLCESELKRYKRMEELYRKEIQIDPTNAIHLYNLGNYYKDVPRSFNDAAPLFEKALKIDPHYSTPAVALGDMYWFLKNDEKTAVKYFKEAERRDPNDGYVNAEWAWALLQHGREDEARKQAEHARYLGETDHPVFKALGIP